MPAPAPPRPAHLLRRGIAYLRRHHVGYVALFAALGGTSYAGVGAVAGSGTQTTSRSISTTHWDWDRPDGPVIMEVGGMARLIVLGCHDQADPFNGAAQPDVGGVDIVNTSDAVLDVAVVGEQVFQLEPGQAASTLPNWGRPLVFSGSTTSSAILHVTPRTLSGNLATVSVSVGDPHNGRCRFHAQATVSQ